MKWCWRLLSALLVLCMLFTFPTPAASQTGTVVRVSPAVVTRSPGESVTIEIWVDTVESLRAFDVEVSFDPAKLFADEESLQLGGFLGSGMGTPTTDVDNDAGLISFGIAIIGNDVQTGSGVLFSFDIETKPSAGETGLFVTSAMLVNEDHFLVEYGVEHGSVRIVGAVDDAYQMPVNETLTVSAPGVLLNDIPPEGVTFTVAKLENPFDGAGVLNWNGDGGFDYTPPIGWTGLTSFTYFACEAPDVNCFGPATVTITVGLDEVDFSVFLPLFLY